jgi:hypothetical protein
MIFPSIQLEAISKVFSFSAVVHFIQEEQFLVLSKHKEKTKSSGE